MFNPTNKRNMMQMECGKWVKKGKYVVEIRQSDRKAEKSLLNAINTETWNMAH